MSLASGISQKNAVKRKVGRPKNANKRVQESNETDDVVNHRTKSGRIVKFTAEVASKIFQLDNNKKEDYISTATSNLEPLDDILQQELPHCLKDFPKKQRKISSQFRCNFCKKIYLGKNKMNHHYKIFPTHRPRPSENESNLFSHLMSLVRQKRTNNEMAEVFFREMSSFVQICEKLTPKLITPSENPSTHTHHIHHVVDKNAASLLRINPGNYRLNMNVFDKDFKFDAPNDNEHVPQIDDEIEETIETLPVLPSKSKPLIIIDDVPSLDGNYGSLLIRQTNELTNLTNISLETEDF